MRDYVIKQGFRRHQRGALIIVTLLILLVVSMLGMATMDTTGLEMQMSSNSRAQQQAFEAAEYTLSWVENNLESTGYFDDISLGNTAGCGSVCFSSACTNGYCFHGTGAGVDYNTCKLNPPVDEPYTQSSLWADGSGKYRTLSVPNTSITAKYIIEYWCYTAREEAFLIAEGNSARLYRITTYVVGEGGRARVMLRSSVKQL